MQTHPDSKPALLTPRDVIDRAIAILRRTWRYWPVEAVAFALGLVAFFVVPKILKPVYVSETVVLHREIIQTENLLGTEEVRMESPHQVAMRLREMLLSRSNLRKIVKEFNLYPKVVSSLGIIDAIERLRNDIDVRVREGQTFIIKYKGDDPDKVYKVTKRLAESLIEQNKEYRTERAEATKNFLEAEEKRTSKALAKKEQELAEFLAAHPEFAQDAAASGQLTAGASVRAAARESATVDPSIAALKRQAQRLRQQLAAPPGAVAKVSLAAVDPKLASELSEAEQELAQAQSNLADKQARYTQQHPDVLAAQARVRTARARVQRLRARAKAAMPSSPAGMSDAERKEKLKAQLAKVEAAIRAAESKKSGADRDKESDEESNRIVSLETRWSGLNRELAEVRERNEQIQKRLFRARMIASVEASGRASQMVVIDPAYKPLRPTRRGKKRTGAAAAAVFMFLGGLIALGLGLIDTRVYDEHDLRSLQLGPIVHVVPTIKTKRAGRAKG